MLEQLLDSISVSGNEQEIAEKIAVLMQPIADKIVQDEMNNTICIINPDSPRRIMLSAHVDEVGLAVTSILPDGRLKVLARGYIIPETYPGHQVKIQTKDGVLYGAVAGWRDLFGKGELKTSELTIDIGAQSAEEAARRVKPGTSVVFDAGMQRMMGHRITARALDDRAGVFIILEALRRAKARGCEIGVYAAATMGEETTDGGAYWCAARIKPEQAVVVDVTYATDYGAVDAVTKGTVNLGGGPTLTNSPVIPHCLNDALAECAAKANIPIQWDTDTKLTFTDADKIHFSNEGVPTVLISLPLRYMHTPAEVADERDIENCTALLTEYLLSL